MMLLLSYYQISLTRKSISEQILGGKSNLMVAHGGKVTLKKDEITAQILEVSS